MAGAKGRSGKVATPDQRAARRAAASAGGRAKSARKEISTEGAAFGVAGWIDRKDQLACELLERKIAAADIDVETAAAKRDQELGKLFTKERVRERDKKAATLYERGLSSLIDLVTKWVSPDKIIQAQSTLHEHAEATLVAIAKEIDS